MKTHLRGPIDYAKTLKLRFRVGGLDLPESRKKPGGRCTDVPLRLRRGKWNPHSERL